MTRPRLLPLLLLVALGASVLSPAAAQALPSEQPAQRAAATKIKYPGAGVEIARLSGKQRQLEGAPRDFKKFIVKRLNQLFREAGSKPKCATAPSIVIGKFDSRGFAAGGEGMYGACPGGGVAVIYAKGDDGWQPILPTQDVRYCEDLAFFGVTDFIGAPDCITEAGRAVAYRSRATLTASPESSARRVARIVGGFPSVPAESVLTTDAADELDTLIAADSFVETDTCVEAGDSDPLADELGDSPSGCSIKVYPTPAKQGKAKSFVLRMDSESVVTSVRPLAA